MGVGKTLVNRTQGTRIASDGLKGRVHEVSLADLQNENDAERAFRKFKLVCIGFTRKQEMSTKKTAYAQAGQVRNIRKKMIDIISREVSATDLKDVVNKLIP